MAPRAKCSKCGQRPAAKGRRGKCSACYQSDYRAGEKTEVDDLGPNPTRIHFKVPRQLGARLHAMAPEAERSRVLRRALEAELERMQDEAAAAAELETIRRLQGA